ncbi:hypothetical protein KSP39_PZI024060 [Platanthera zijinensis]|uniref:Uncharacterized protein n=1 Tax=Platanthera zijinensis TaxID=2320716 RepID=A0AAP0AU30_9ASPA
MNSHLLLLFADCCLLGPVPGIITSFQQSPSLSSSWAYTLRSEISPGLPHRLPDRSQRHPQPSPFNILIFKTMTTVLHSHIPFTHNPLTNPSLSHPATVIVETGNRPLWSSTLGEGGGLAPTSLLQEKQQKRERDREQDQGPGSEVPPHTRKILERFPSLTSCRAKITLDGLQITCPWWPEFTKKPLGLACQQPNPAVLAGYAHLLSSHPLSSGGRWTTADLPERGGWGPARLGDAGGGWPA